MASRLSRYLQDPFLLRMYRAVRTAGPLRSIALDLTAACNLRCDGCYFFAEGMDALPAAGGEDDFDALLEREKSRGTNFVTLVGGEPSLVPDRLAKIYSAFRTNVATNGLRRIPRRGFEELPIGISVWGDPETDRRLRGGAKIDVFERALSLYSSSITVMD